MTTGRRQKNVRNFVQELDGTGTLIEKLEAANRILHERISPIDNRGRRVELPNPLLAIDLQLTTAEYLWLIELLGDSLDGIAKNSEALERMFSRYPMVFISSLTGTALLDSSGSYWEAFWRRVRIREPELLYDLIRRELRPEFHRKNLATFSDADLIGKNYVGSIQLHAGILPHDLDLLLSFIGEVKKQNFSLGKPEAFAEYAVTTFSQNQGDYRVTPSLRRLATHLSGRATDIFARVYEIYDWYHALEDKKSADSFEGTHGLPEPTFVYLLKSLLGEVEESVPETSSPSKTFYQSPIPQLDLDTLEFHLIFPEITESRNSERTAPEWTVLIDEAPITVTLRENWSTGGYEEYRLPLTKPFAKLMVVGPNGDTRTVVENFDSQRPMLFLRANGQVLKDQSKLNGRNTIAIMPAAAIVSASTRRSHGFSTQDLGPVHGWQDWIVREFSLEYVKTLTVAYRSVRENIKINQVREAVWIEQDAEIPYLKGPDQFPVFRESPRLKIPADNSTWMLRYYQLTHTGERIDMDSYEVEDDLRDVDFEVFDIADDPWVGRFQVEIYKDAKRRDIRSFNLAEGLNLKLRFPKSGVNGQFQVPEQTKQGPSLSQVFGEFTSDVDSGLVHPHGSQEIRTTDIPQRFSIASREDPEAYSLLVTIKAPRLKYRLPLLDEISPWSASLQTFNFDELADNEDFQLRFPSKINDAKLVISKIVNKGRSQLIQGTQSISLSRKGNSHVWLVPMSRISEAMASEAEYSVVATWSALTVEEHLSQKMDKWARKDWFDLPKGRRPDLREAALVPLFQVTKKPLLTSARVDGDQISLTLGRSTSQPLEVWAWLVHKPLDLPIQIPMTGRKGTFPEELREEGPLIIEAREEAFLSFWQPESPSPRAVVADQPSTLEPHLDPFIKHRWLFAEHTERELLPNEIQVVWEARNKLHHILGRRENREIPSLYSFDIASSNYLLHNPRTALDELDRSSIPQEHQFEAFIRSGLVTKSFSAWNTAGEIHPVPWIGLIQEMNDLRVLKSRLATDTSISAEKAESEHYIRSIGGPDLWRAFTHTGEGIPVIRKNIFSSKEIDIVRTQGLESIREHLGIQALGASFISEESRRSGQLEWLEHRRELSSNPRLQELFDAASSWENLMDHLDDPELKRTALNLSEMHKGQRLSDKDNWLYVPYISFVFSFLARMVAHGIIRPVPALQELQHSWATVAKYIPTLTGFDLVIAEAAALHTAGSPTNKN